jgi:PRA1 family protein 1
LSRPAGWGDAQSRINFNLGYFSTNYLIIFALLSVYSLLTNLLLLFVIIFVFVGMFLIGSLNGQDLVLPFGTIPSSSLYTGLFIIAVPLGIFASPLSTLLWLIGASGVCILGHATLMEKPIESAFAEETV